LGEEKMWVITVFTEQNVTMYEFENESEARESIQTMKGRKILSHVVYYNDKILEGVV
jgi:ArsR family metal-binding transcriptional regulator